MLLALFVTCCLALLWLTATALGSSPSLGYSSDGSGLAGSSSGGGGGALGSVASGLLALRRRGHAGGGGGGGGGGRRELVPRHTAPHLRSLVVVACHSVFSGLDFRQAEDVSSWLLLDYQKASAARCLLSDGRQERRARALRRTAGPCPPLGPPPSAACAHGCRARRRGRCRTCRDRLTPS